MSLLDSYDQIAIVCFKQELINMIKKSETFEEYSEIEVLRWSN